MKVKIRPISTDGVWAKHWEIRHVDLSLIPLYNSDIESQGRQCLRRMPIRCLIHGSWSLNKLKCERCEGIMSKQKLYYGKDIEVMFNSEVCIHSGICVKGLPGVFDLSKRPWINLDGDTSEAIARHIDTCPSGALTYRRLEDEYSTRKEE